MNTSEAYSCAECSTSPSTQEMSETWRKLFICIQFHVIWRVDRLDILYHSGDMSFNDCRQLPLPCWKPPEVEMCIN